MGKKYYCNYCDKTIAALPGAIKIHNKGLEHQKLLHEHYQQFKDPETIVEEESKKIPCTKYKNGECPFGSICKFSHYTREEIQFLRHQVQSKKTQEQSSQPSLLDLYKKLQNEKSEAKQTETLLVDANECTHILPWTYNERVEEIFGDNLPPSLRRITAENLCFTPAQWG